MYRPRARSSHILFLVLSQEVQQNVQCTVSEGIRVDQYSLIKSSDQHWDIAGWGQETHLHIILGHNSGINTPETNSVSSPSLGR